jgi:hypothetical protein
MIKKQFLVDRVVALFHNIQLKHGIGNLYKSKLVRGFGHHFEFCNIIFLDSEISMGLHHGTLSSTVLFCQGHNAFKHETEGVVIHSLLAGKIGPDANYYESKIVLNSYFERPMITALEIIGYLGNISALSEIPKDSVLEIILADDGSVAEIKKHF